MRSIRAPSTPSSLKAADAVTRGEASLDAAARSIVQQVTGAPPSRSEKISAGVMTFKFAVTSASGDRIVVRFYPQARSHVVRYEPDVIARCRAHGLRAPELLADSRLGPAAPLSYVAYRMIDGVPLHDRLAQLPSSAIRSIAESLCSALRSMRELGMDGFGDLETARAARFPSWEAFTSESLGEGIAMARARRLLGDKQIDRLERILDGNEAFAPRVPSCLAWGDVSPENVILDERDRVAGLVDFEGVLAADALLNLGYMSVRDPDATLYRALVRSWPEPLAEDDLARVDYYGVLRGARLLKHGGAALPTGLPSLPVTQFLAGFDRALDRAYRWLQRRRA